MSLDKRRLTCSESNHASWGGLYERDNCARTSAAIVLWLDLSVVLGINSQPRNGTLSQMTVFLSLVWRFEVSATTRWFSAEMPGITTSHHQAHFTKLLPSCANMHVLLFWLSCNVWVLGNIRSLRGCRLCAGICCHTFIFGDFYIPMQRSSVMHLWGKQFQTVVKADPVFPWYKFKV